MASHHFRLRFDIESCRIKRDDLAKKEKNKNTKTNYLYSKVTFVGRRGYICFCSPPSPLPPVVTVANYFCN